MARGTAPPHLHTLPRSAGAGVGLASGGTLTQVVAGHIRSAIVDGRLALGEALSELSLAQALGVSRTPVREALGVLQREGLICVRPQAGSFVFLPTEADVAELAEFRRVLEATALAFSHARQRQATLRALRAAVRAMALALAADDRVAASRADTAFHEALVGHSANQHLVAAYRGVSGRVAALRSHNLMWAGAMPSRPLAEHRAIVAALARNDLATATQLLDQHVLHLGHRYQAPTDRHRTPTNPGT